MNTNIKHALVAFTAGCVVVPTFSQAAENRTRTAASIGSDDLEEVIITAQRREENLQNVPISVSVLTGEKLDRSNDRGVAEALNRVPGVISASSTGNARNTSATGGVVVVRGVAPAAGGSTTGYYLDSIPFGFSGDVFNAAYAPDPNSYDMARVEVLRGPQGTLYGVNALNGVVRVLTKDANLNDFELKGRVSASSTKYGGQNYRGDMAINIPLIEGKLAARAVAGYQDWDGWVDKPNKKDANSARVGNYRLKINAQPTDKFSVGVFGWVSRSKADAPPIGPDGLHSPTTLEEPSSADYEAFGAKLGYDFSAFTVTSMTSYIDFRVHGEFDYSPFIPAETVLKTDIDSRMFSEEIVLNSTDVGPWRWTLGGMYRIANDEVYQFRSLYVSGLPGTNNGVEAKSVTIFGELTRLFMDDRLELTGGLRYFKDKKRNWEKSRFSLIGGTIDSTTGRNGLFPDVNDRYSKVTPRVVLAWHPSKQAMIYATYSEGFRSGLNQFAGVRAAAPEYPSAAPDDLKSYEVGMKGSAWDGRFSFDSAVYYLDWRGVQQTLSVTVTTVPLYVSGAYVNAQSASGMGAEFGVAVEAMRGLTLSANASWNDLQVDHDVVSGVGATAVVLYAEGQRINLSPKYTVGASVDYAFPFGSSGLQGRFAVSENYLPQMIVDRASATNLIYADSVSMLRASVGVESQGRWSASLYGDNLTDARGISHDRFSPRWNSSIRPLTIGAQVELHY